MGVQQTPFVDTSGEDPKALDDLHMTNCRGSSAGDGKCTRMGLEFDTIDEWKEHRSKHHPTACGKSDCSILAAYRRDGAPHGRCYKHIPDDPEVAYRWKRINTKSVVEPPKAPEDHPIEMALGGGNDA